MQHSCATLPLAARSRFQVIVLVFALTACDRDAELTIVLDTTFVQRDVEVLAIPVAPHTLRAPAPSGTAHPRPLADSLDLHARVADSARVMDERFQSERETLNREAAVLDTADRRTVGYAEAWESHRRRTREAELVRDVRDRLRTRLQELAARLEAHLPSPEREAAEAAELRSRMLGASDDVRRAKTASVRNGAATLSLEPGAWWIGVSAGLAPPTRFDSVLVTAGSRDSVRIRP